MAWHDGTYAVGFEKQILVSRVLLSKRKSEDISWVY